MSIRVSACGLLVAAPLMLVAPATAQQANPSTPQGTPPATGQSTDPKACAPGERATVGQGGKAPSAPQTGSGNLSDQLARTDGVICPPANVDPDIHAAPPAGGATPVIPPPGSPGSDPSVRPK